MIFVFISPNFPSIYSHFVKALKDKKVTVLGIGDTPYNELNDELKQNLTEYCYCWDLSNLQWMKNTIDYLKNKYGKIDYIESNNEFWLMNDAELRAYADVDNGFKPREMRKIKYKSQMKEYFQLAGAKVARYILVTDLESCLSFIEKVGYPVFCKPDSGVGAVATYKINNDEELRNFINEVRGQTYIMEEYVSGYITSFDGVCDNEGNVVVCYKEVFPVPIDQIVKTGCDVYYYASCQMNKDFYEIGCKVVKSFGVKNRCFHIEFFVLDQDKEGLGKKGDYIALEVNMRSPGGNTPDLLSLASNINYYEAYADVIWNGKVNKYKITNSYVSISANRRDENNYQHTNEEIWQKYGDKIKSYGRYPNELSAAMGNTFYFGQFDNEKEALYFKDFVLLKY